MSKDPKSSEVNLPQNYALTPGEQILWLHHVSKGLFHKEVVEEWAITNMRAMKRFPVTKENLQPRIIYVGLSISDSVVMNQHRKSQGTRVGNFVGEGSGGSFSGVTAGTSRSTSTTYGDLVFFAKGKEILRFREISDPHDVHIMIETVKKQMARL